MKPLAFDLGCGLGGWTDGLQAEGYHCIGVDIEAHCYDGQRYPGTLWIQDVRTIHGSQLAGADLIVASMPCTEFSYMAMPWRRSKQIAAALRGEGDFPEGYRGSRTITELTELFNACFRIQREACEAAGRHIPLIVENVRGAQPWVGRARWSFGSFYLWGDVPALMPITAKAVKVPTMGAGWYPPDHPKHVAGLGFNTHADRNLREEIKVSGFRFDGSGGSFQSASVAVLKENGDPHHKFMPVPQEEGRKGVGSGSAWFHGNQGQYSSKSSARKMASAMIAKIPLPLSRHIARTFYPRQEAAE